MKRIILTTIAVLASAAAFSASMDWASDKQRDVASRLGSAFASTEVCDVDIDSDRAAQVIRENFGSTMSADRVASLMYQVVVFRAGQGVRLRRMNPAEAKDWCQAIQNLYGAQGKDFRGLLR